MKEITTVIYEAFTGTKFNIKEECLEYEQMLTEKMARIIKRECNSYADCSKCRFVDDEGCCPLAGEYRSPGDWKID